MGNRTHDLPAQSIRQNIIFIMCLRIEKKVHFSLKLKILVYCIKICFTTGIVFLKDILEV